MTSAYPAGMPSDGLGLAAGRGQAGLETIQHAAAPAAWRHRLQPHGRVSVAPRARHPQGASAASEAASADLRAACSDRHSPGRSADSLFADMDAIDDPRDGQEGQAGRDPGQYRAPACRRHRDRRDNKADERRDLQERASG